jgi:UDP-glucose 4-epimerase
MKKLLITGASGFIGQYLVKALDSEYEVHGLYEHKASFAKNPELEGRQWLADLKDKEALEMTIANIAPHFIIHLAAKTEVALSFDNYAEVSEVNYLGTVNLVEANRLFNPNLELFLMASTMETYGHQDQVPFTEETPQYPMAPYAVAKLACEKYLAYMEYAYGFPFCIFRQTNAYGRTDNDFFVVERIVTQMLRGDECNLGEKEPVRNFIWIDDLVELYRTVLAQTEKAKGQTFVTGPNNGLTIEELADIIKSKTGFKGRLNWGTIPKRPGEIYYLNSDAQKAKDVLRWEPKIDLQEGLDRTIAIWREKVV